MDLIKEDTMLDGDVMLFHGDAWLSKAIQFFDGTEVNHAAVFLGSNKVGEAKGQGLVESTFQESMGGEEYVIVRRLTSHPGTMQPVLDKAHAYLMNGNRYGFEQIVLLAFLGITRKIPVNAYLNWLLRKVLDAASNLLMKHGNKQPMICSEFVYRCYDEALPTSNDLYTLEINPFPVSLRMGAAGVRGMAVQPHRQRMHRDSLLAWAEDIMTARNRPASNALIMSFEQPARAKARVPLSREEKKIADMSLDKLMKKYLEETRKPAARAYEMEASLRSAEMLAGIKNFAEAYHRATRKGPAKKAESWSAKAMAGEVPEALELVLRTVADFVTPGDLYNCKNLYNLGKIGA